MSNGFQAKMSWFAVRKVTSTCSYFGSRPIPTRAILDESVGSSKIFLVSFTNWILRIAGFLAGAPSLPSQFITSSRILFFLTELPRACTSSQFLALWLPLGWNGHNASLLFSQGLVL
uniref:Uncharacterized protein n=1 Tax=Arundo donax TaxID=35708 RepID=A0A0A9SIR8_ARUDO